MFLRIYQDTLVFFCICLIAESSVCAYVKSMALGSNPKYSDEFGYFEYTDPNAEVGGELRMASMGTFDKVNPFSLRGSLLQEFGSNFEPLAIFSLDEPMTIAGC